MKKLLLLVSIIFIGYVNYFAQGTTCATATPVSSSSCSGAGSFNNTGVTGTLAAGSCWTGGTNNGMWFQFVASSPTANITINGTTLTQPQAMLIEPSSGCNGTFTEIGCASPGTASATMSSSSLTPGNTYFIYVDGRNNIVGTFEICISSPTPPANDSPCSPFVVPASNFCSSVGAYTNVGATAENLLSAGFPACWNLGTNNTVWFQYTATGVYNQISVTGSAGGIQPQVSVMQTGSCSGTAWTNNGASNCAAAASGNTVTMNANNLTIGQTYLIAVDGVNNTVGSFQLCVNSYTPSAVPPNDLCANAIPLCPGMTYTGTTNGATNTGSINTSNWNCNAVNDNIVWYTFVASTPVQPVVFNITGSCNGTASSHTLQSEVFRYTGAGSPCSNSANWSSLGCNNSITSTTGASATITIPAASMTAGSTYYLLFDNWPGDYCNFNFSVTGNAGASAGAGQTICSTAAPFNNVGSPAGGTWSGPGITNATNGTFNPALVGTGSYTVFYTVGNCVSQKIITVAGVQVTVSNNVSICQGQSTTLLGNVTPFPTSSTVPFSNNTVVAIPDNGVGNNWNGTTGTYATSNITTTGLNPGWSLSSVTFNINHTYDGDLTIYIRNPCGGIYKLVDNRGGGGDNFVNTTFSSSGTANISTGTAPFSGNWIPEGTLAAWNAFLASCTTGNGTWSLLVGDDTGSDVGTIQNWSLNFNNPTVSTYTWSPTTNMTGSTTLSPVVSPPTTTTYTLTATVLGCSNSASVTVTVIASPPAPVAPNVNYCIGAIASPLTATALAGNTLNWWGTSATGGTSSSTPPTPSTASSGTTLYYVSQTNATGCESPRTAITVTINPLPTITGTLNACIGSTSPLTGSATAAASTPWVSSNTSVASISSTGVVTAVSVGTTNITYTNTNGCSNVVVFTVNPLPTITGTLSACIGLTSTLTGSASQAAVNPWISATPAVATISSTGVVTAESAGSSIITYTNSNGCQITAVFTVNALPTIGGSLSECIGATSALVGSGTPAAVDPWVSATPSVATVSSTGVVTAVSAGSSVITYTNSNGCQITATFTVKPTPTVNAGLAQTVCNGTNVTLSGSGTATSYTWSPVVTNGVAFLPPASTTTTYTVTGTLNGCTNTSTVDVTSNSSPVVGTTNVSICAGGTIALNASGATTYTWSPATYLSATTGSSVNFVNGTTTTYTVTGTSLGCTSSSPLTVTVTPSAPINAGADLTTCVGTPITITATGGVTYSWSPATFISATTGGSVTFTPGTTTTYTVTGTDAGGCVGSDQMVVTVNPLPTATIAGTVTVCQGAPSQTITFTGAGATAPYTFTYSLNGGANQTVTSVGNIATVTATTGTSGTFTYTLVSVSSANSCSQAQAGNAIVTVTPLPTATISGTTTLCQNATAPNITFTGANGTAPYTFTYNINGGGNLTATTTVGNSVTVSAPTGTVGTFNYNLISVSSANTCSQAQVGTATVTITPLPTATVSGTTSVCQNAPTPNITFTGANATAPYTFTYNINGGAAQTVTSVGNTATVSAPTGTVGSFVYNLVSVASANTCSQAQAGTATVTVNALPSPIINGAATYCAGQFSTLSTSIPFTTYLWSTGVTTPTANVTIANNPISVSVTNAQGCTATSSTFTVSENTVITYNSSVAICQGQSVMIHGVSQNTAGTYSQTYVLGTGCDSTSNVTLTVNSLPVIAVADQTVCAGTAVTLSGNGANTYSWTGGITNGTPFTPAATTTYTVTGTNTTTGCTNTDPATITLNPLPTATISGTMSICRNGINPTITFTGANGTAPYTFTYNINGGGNLTVTSVGNTATVSAPTSTVGSFAYNLVSVQDASSTACSQAQVGTATITVNPLPTATVSGTATVCLNGVNPTITFTGANGTSPYTFTYNINGSGNLTVTSVGNTATVSAPTTTVGSFVYNLVSVQDASSTACSQAQVGSATITVNPLPTATIGGTATVCQNAAVPSITFTGANSTAPYTFTYNINGGPNQTVSTTGGSSSITVNASTSTAGTFTYNLVSVVSSTTCTQAQTGTATITVNPLPTATISGATTVCINGVAPTLTFTGSNGTAPYTFTYNINGGLNQTVNSVGNTATVSAPTSVTGAFSYNIVSVTSAMGCSQAQVGSALITVVALPIVNAGNDIPLCEGQTVILTGSGASTYSWDNGVSNGISFTPPLGTTTYTVTGTSAAGCVNTDQMNIIVSPIPNVSFTPDITSGCVPLTVNFTNTTPNSSNCVWTISNGAVLTGCGTVSSTFNQPGCYDITLTTTSTNGCTNSFTAVNLICVEGGPDASFTPSVAIINEFNSVVNFNNTTTGATTYLWNFGDNSGTSTIVNPSHDYTGNDIGNYFITLIAYSPLGCSDTAFVSIQMQEQLLFYIPNTFTPDDDKYNPIFKPIFTSGFDPFSYTLLIFNRWGEIIFESHNTEIGWDGSYGSNREIDMVQDGTYTWKIEFKTNKNDEHKMVIGHVNVIR